MGLDESFEEKYRKKYADGGYHVGHLETEEERAEREQCEFSYGNYSAMSESRPLTWKDFPDIYLPIEEYDWLCKNHPEIINSPHNRFYPLKND